MCSSTPKRMAARGMKKLVKKQLGVVAWMCSSTPGRMVALGIRGPVRRQPRVVLWMCSSGRSKMAALTRLITAPGKLSKSLDWLEPPNLLVQPSILLIFPFKPSLRDFKRSTFDNARQSFERHSRRAFRMDSGENGLNKIVPKQGRFRIESGSLQSTSALQGSALQATAGFLP